MRTQNEIDGIDLDWREDEDFYEMIFRKRAVPASFTHALHHAFHKKETI